jgi:hypothetical protein
MLMRISTEKLEKALALSGITKAKRDKVVTLVNQRTMVPLKELCEEVGLAYTTGVEWAMGRTEKGILTVQPKVYSERGPKEWVKGGGRIFVDKDAFLFLVNNRPKTGRKPKRPKTLP